MTEKWVNIVITVIMIFLTRAVIASSISFDVAATETVPYYDHYIPVPVWGDYHRLHLLEKASSAEVALAYEECIKPDINLTVYRTEGSNSFHRTSWGTLGINGHVTSVVITSGSLTNSCQYPITAYLGFTTQRDTPLYISTYIIPAAFTCSFTLPDKVDMGTFSGDLFMNTNQVAGPSFNIAYNCPTAGWVSHSGSYNRESNYIISNDLTFSLFRDSQHTTKWVPNTVEHFSPGQGNIIVSTSLLGEFGKAYPSSEGEASVIFSIGMP